MGVGKIGLSVAGLHPGLLVEMAKDAEQLGYESLWLGDHIAIPTEVRSPYPYGPVPGFNTSSRVLEMFTVLSWLAASTTTIRIGTNVCILPMRDFLTSARVITTLDVMSGGRFMLGVGAGWMAEEFDLLGQSFVHRGRRLDEQIQALRRTWQPDPVAFHGEEIDFGPMGFEPKPVGTIPILVGGQSGAALRRAALYGDGWIGVNETPQSVRRALTRIEELQKAHRFATRPLEVTTGLENLDPDAMEVLEDSGVHRFIVQPWSRSREARDAIATFAARAGLVP
jgi:probable F420-dependent oxidoreductase